MRGIGARGIALGTIMGLLSGSALAQGSGRATALSGDTLQLGADTFFLNGIVAPTGSDDARRRLSELVSGHAVTCEVQPQTQGSHPTAICSIEGADLSEALIRSGVVFALVENGVDMSDLQAGSRETGAGLWSEEGMKDAAEEVAKGSKPPRDCTIKGNKSRKPPYELKYHLVDTAYYGRTRVDLKRGERWFCSVKDASRAGYSRSGE